MYKGVECQSLESDDMEESKPVPFCRNVGNCRLSSTGKSIMIHFFEQNRYFSISVDDIKEAIETPTTIVSMKEYLGKKE